MRSENKLEKNTKKCWVEFIVPGDSRASWPSHSLPGSTSKLYQSRTSVLVPRIHPHDSHGLPIFPKLNLVILAHSSWFNSIFLFIITFASYLYHLISFLWTVSRFTIARFCCFVLGFLCAGKIGPHERHHDVQNVKTVRFMELDVIYHAHGGFWDKPGM